MTLYLISLGFNVTHILSRIRDISPSKGDIFIFLRPISEDIDEGSSNRREQAEKALYLALNPLKEYAKIEYKIVDIDDADFEKSLIYIFDLTMYIKGEFYRDAIEVWAVGGTRSLVAILVLYGQIDPRVKRLYGFSEKSSTFPEIPTINKEYISGKKNIERVYRFLNALEKGEEIPQLSEKKIKRLINDGLIRKTRGRRARYEITNVG